MLPFTTQPMSISTNGICLHAEVAGPEEGPLVILLHGFPEFWGAWINQIGPLARSGFRVVALDQRGYNLSDKPAAVEAYRLDELCADVLGVIDFFGREKAMLVGHDWGAAVAWYTTMHHPERVERLAILNVPHQAVMNAALEQLDFRQIGKSWYIAYFQIPGLPERMIRPGLPYTMRRTARPGTFSGDMIARYKEAWDQPGALTGGMNWYRAIAREGAALGREAFNRKYQRRITVPTLVLWGDRDAFIMHYLADRSMEWVDDGKLVHFPEATHWLHHEEPERINNHLIDFFKEG